MANVLLSASVIIAGVLWVYSVTMEDGQMSNHERTMTFTCFVFFDMFNALSSRSQDRLIFEIGFFSNKCVLQYLNTPYQEHAYAANDRANSFLSIA